MMVYSEVLYQIDDEMTIEEIFNSCEFKGSLIGTETFEIKLPLTLANFDRTIDLYISQIPSQSMNTHIFLKIEKSVNNLMNLKHDLVKLIWSEVWNKYVYICEQTAPKVNDGSIDAKSTNMNYFMIYDINSLKENTLISNITTQLTTFDERCINTITNEITWNFYFNSEWIGDGFLRVLIDKENVQDAEIHW
jgi:hypothetical protein